MDLAYLKYYVKHCLPRYPRALITEAPAPNIIIPDQPVLCPQKRERSYLSCPGGISSMSKFDDVVCPGGLSSMSKFDDVVCVDLLTQAGAVHQERLRKMFGQFNGCTASNASRLTVANHRG